MLILAAIVRKTERNKIMNGFEYTISVGKTTLYISNKPRTGFVSFIIADKQPSLLDVKERNISDRFDVTEEDFKQLIDRLKNRADQMHPATKREQHTAQVYEAK